VTGLPPDLPPAAQAYLDAFPPGDLVAFPIDPIDHIGIPVWVVALFPTDPALDGIMPYGVGYGSTPGAAVLGALGEIAEMTFPTLALGRRATVQGSFDDLVRTYGRTAVADPLTLCLPAGSPVGRDTVLRWTEATRWATGETVLVPLELAAYSSKELPEGYAPFTTIISNGMGAGQDIDWAVGHGLLELLQRDGNGLCFRALDRGVLLDLPEALPASTQALLDRFEAADIHIMPKFATDAFGISNLYCVGYDRDARDAAAPIMVTACGEAAHPDRHAALDKALTEFAASRARKAFAHGHRALVDRVAPPGYVDRFLRQAGHAAKSSDHRAFTTMADWVGRDAAQLRAWLADTVHADRVRKSFDQLPEVGESSSGERGRIARERLYEAGFDILYVDVSPPGREVSCVKVIVP
jgi:ribosomal protein S12 methylthiotransferase accessory factor